MSINQLSTRVGEQVSTPPLPLNTKHEFARTEVSDRTVSRAVKVQKDDTTPSVDKGNTEEQLSAQVLRLDADKQDVRDKQQQQEISQREQAGESLSHSLQQAIDKSNEFSGLQVRKLEFSSSEESGRLVVKVLDKESNEVIRQIPSEDFIRVADKMNGLSSEPNSVKGLLFESKV